MRPTSFQLALNELDTVSTGGRSPDTDYWRRLGDHCLVRSLAAPTLTRAQFWSKAAAKCEAARIGISSRTD
jgi:hypothetical protein